MTTAVWPPAEFTAVRAFQCLPDLFDLRLDVAGERPLELRDVPETALVAVVVAVDAGAEQTRTAEVCATLAELANERALGGAARFFDLLSRDPVLGALAQLVLEFIATTELPPYGLTISAEGVFRSSGYGLGRGRTWPKPGDPAGPPPWRPAP